MFLSFNAKQVIKNWLEGKTPAGYSGIFNKTKIINKQELLGFFYTKKNCLQTNDKQAIFLGRGGETRKVEGKKAPL